ncbi:MAG TPA: hypothetical protein VJ302_36940 [Blastocatellia bacterium]|nr:hypothetical protein [Blastocatellia bacterium]
MIDRNKLAAGCVHVATVVRGVSPIIAVLIVCVLQATAQSVIGNDATRTVALLKRGIDVFAWLMLIGGVAAVGRGIFLGWRGQQGALTPIAWGIGGMGFSFLVSWINGEVNGNAVALPEP